MKTPILWKHQTYYRVFILYIDDFGSKANSLYDAHHLLNSIRKHFKYSIDWEGQNYLGLTLDWNYYEKYFYISMPGYVQTELHKFQQKPPAYAQDAPHPWNKPVH